MRPAPASIGRRQRRRRIALATIRRREWLLQILALGAAGCGRGGDRAYSRREAITVAVSDVKTLNPNYSDDSLFLVFLPLLAVSTTGELEGRLARTWEHSPDYREWTYHLRPGARWHDGVPVTAHDVKFTLELMMRPDVGELGPGAFESITVHDEVTITIRSGHVRDYQAWALYYPRHLLQHLEPAKFYEWDFWTHPVGNGPYRFVRYLPDTMIELQANSDYYAGKPKIERVVLKFTGAAGLIELLSGNVDAILESNPADIPKLAMDPRFRVYHSYVGGVSRAIYWRHTHPLLRDPAVRLALTLAIDRRELLRVLNLPEDVPILDGPFTARQIRRGDLPEPLPYDPRQARALLEGAGWHDRNGEGARERGGEACRFTAITSTYSAFTETAVFVQAQLRRVGVIMDLQVLEQDLVRSRLATGDFDALFNFIGAGPDTLRYFGRDSPVGYRNAEVIALIDRALDTADPDLEAALYRELVAIFQVDVPATYLSPRVETTFTHRRIRGLSSPFRASPVAHMDEVWLES